jgi:hypothetical protein
MLVFMKLAADFSRGCVGKTISHLLSATHPHRDLHYIFLGFLNHGLLKSFTATPICGINRGNRCSYSSFPILPITPIRAPALATQTVSMLDPPVNPV